MTATAVDHVTFITPGLTCGHCVAKVQDAVKKVDGVVSVQASAETRFVDVDFDPMVVTSLEVARAMADAGYPVRA